MVLPPIKINLGVKQFQDLQKLYNNAIFALISLNRIHPEYAQVWQNTILRLRLIQGSLESKTLPTFSKKKKAELSTMLIYECPDMSNTGELTALFELDNAYQLLGIQHLTEIELDKFYKKMGCR